MPYWNEIPGAGGPAPLNKSRRKSLKHGIFLGVILSAIYSVKQASEAHTGDPLMTALNLFAGVFIVGPLSGFMVIGPLLGWFYQWRLITYRRRHGLPSPSPHSYGGDIWLELDEDDPLRAAVDARLSAQSKFK